MKKRSDDYFILVWLLLPALMIFFGGGILIIFILAGFWGFFDGVIRSDVNAAVEGAKYVLYFTGILSLVFIPSIIMFVARYLIRKYKSSWLDSFYVISYWIALIIVLVFAGMFFEGKFSMVG